MSLATGFQFSQGSLQDYVDCPRRFQLRYVRGVRWPAVEAEPALEHERHLRQGAAFHRLIRQHLTGIPVDRLSRTVSDPELRRWWRSYVETGLVDIPEQRYTEVRLSTSVSDYGLVAQYDVIAVAPDQRFFIVDWKTSRRRPRRAWLSERLQTHVYPYVLVQAGDTLDTGIVVKPDQVTMVYWFANFAAEPERFTYDARHYRADQQYLSDLIEAAAEEVRGCAGGDLLPPAEDRSRCGFCRYRSLCQRGVEPERLEAGEERMMSDEPLDVSLDFEQIAELDAA